MEDGAVPRAWLLASGVAAAVRFIADFGAGIITIAGAIGVVLRHFLRVKPRREEEAAHEAYQRRLREQNAELDQLTDEIKGGRK